MDSESYRVAVKLGYAQWVYLGFNWWGVSKWTQEADRAFPFKTALDATTWMAENMPGRDYDLYRVTVESARIGVFRRKGAYQDVCGGNMPGCKGGPGCKSDHK